MHLAIQSVYVQSPDDQYVTIACLLVMEESLTSLLKKFHFMWSCQSQDCQPSQVISLETKWRPNKIDNFKKKFKSYTVSFKTDREIGPTNLDMGEQNRDYAH